MQQNLLGQARPREPAGSPPAPEAHGGWEGVKDRWQRWPTRAASFGDRADELWIWSNVLGIRTSTRGRVVKDCRAEGGSAEHLGFGACQITWRALLLDFNRVAAILGWQFDTSVSVSLPAFALQISCSNLWRIEPMGSTDVWKSNLAGFVRNIKRLEVRLTEHSRTSAGSALSKGI
jgi:hypothetical protein